MYRNSYRHRLITLALGTAMTSALLAGCASGGAQPARLAASDGDTARPDQSAKAQAKSLAKAEAAVLTAPNDAAARAMLGAAYLDAGRFASAATAFDDAMTLGDTNPRTALSLALALSAAGETNEAVALLREWQDEIAPADLGLALSLAGLPDRGIHVITNGIRAGDASAKARQNLAYSYALAGRWREARIMASQDLPQNQVGPRMEEWARTVAPAQTRQRIAALLDVPVYAVDEGQPAMLALGGGAASANAMAMRESAATVPSYPAAGELPPVADIGAVEPARPSAMASRAPVPQPLAPMPQPGPVAVAAAPVAAPVPAPLPAPQPRNFEQAFEQAAPQPASLARVTTDTARFAAAQAAAPAPTRSAARTVTQPAPARSSNVVADVEQAQGSHLVQLGSFSSEAGAKRAWGIYVKRYPQLANHEMVITEAVVRGKRYWRVSAGGYERNTAQSMCSTVKGKGQGCFAWAADRPMPGAVDSGYRMARR